MLRTPENSPTRKRDQPAPERAVRRSVPPGYRRWRLPPEDPRGSLIEHMGSGVQVPCEQLDELVAWVDGGMQGPPPSTGDVVASGTAPSVDTDANTETDSPADAHSPADVAGVPELDQVLAAQVLRRLDQLALQVQQLTTLVDERLRTDGKAAEAG